MKNSGGSEKNSGGRRRLIICKCNTMMKIPQPLTQYTVSAHVQIKYVCPNCTKTCSVIYKPEKITWYDPNGDKEVERPK